MTSEDPGARFERLIGKVLLLGVGLAAAIVLAGAVLYLVRHGHETARYGIFHGEPTALRTIHGVILSSAALSARAIIQLGLIVLVAVQLVRVGLTVWLFWVARDRVFVAVSVVVLAMLLYSLVGKG
ncbi:MAG: DUF1634 domain-containing protein [Myxococcota bacterium]